MTMTMTDPEKSNLKMSFARHLIVLITGHALNIPFFAFHRRNVKFVHPVSSSSF